MPDESGLADYCWVDLTADGEDVLELAENLGGLEGGHNGGQPQRVHLKVRVFAHVTVRRRWMYAIQHRAVEGGVGGTTFYARADGCLSSRSGWSR